VPATLHPMIFHGKTPVDSSLLVTHLLLPLLLFAACAAWIQVSGLDLWFADRIFAWSGDVWLLRDNWLTSGVIHDGGRDLVALLLLTLIVLLLGSFRIQSLQQYRRGLCYVLVTALLSGIVVNLLKQWSGVACPWDLQRYGGAFAYEAVSGARGNAEISGCFPAGHASAAYAWLGLYYFMRVHFPPYRFRVLLVVLLAGITFGVGQQLRGAHFLSHDLWSLAICWVIATAFQVLLDGHAGTKSAS
jgi:membrane-associated PAP2 superfamily phosphatase